MADCCATDPKDLVGNRRISLLVWGLPLIAFVLGVFLSPAFRMALWPASLSTAGVTCLVNASRCGRMHCYFTGPFYLIGAVAALTYGSGLLPLGPHGWIWIGVTMAVGGCILHHLPERFWGKYAAGRESNDAVTSGKAGRPNTAH